MKETGLANTWKRASIVAGLAGFLLLCAAPGAAADSAPGPLTVGSKGCGVKANPSGGNGSWSVNTCVSEGLALAQETCDWAFSNPVTRSDCPIVTL